MAKGGGSAGRSGGSASNSRATGPAALTALDRRFAIEVGGDQRHVLYLKN
jgi:hypothetical protein